MRISHRVLVALLVAGAALALPGAAGAQGRSHGRAQGGMPPGQAKKHVTTDRAILVTRDVFVRHGYEVVRIGSRGDVRVVYYRRGNMGRGRGRGPVETMIIRPSNDIVVIERAPSRTLLAEIKINLGL